MFIDSQSNKAMLAFTYGEMQLHHGCKPSVILGNHL